MKCSGPASKTREGLKSAVRRRMLVRFVRDQSGGIAVMAAASVVGMLGLGALAVDLGSMYNVRDRLQNAADAAALDSLEILTADGGAFTDWAILEKSIKDFGILSARRNARSADQPEKMISASDIETGHYSERNQQFIPGSVNSLGGRSVNAVRATVHRTTAKQNPVKLLFAPVLGQDKMNISATSIAFATNRTRTTCVKLRHLKVSGKMLFERPSECHLAIQKLEAANCRNHSNQKIYTKYNKKSVCGKRVTGDARVKAPFTEKELIREKSRAREITTGKRPNTGQRLILKPGYYPGGIKIYARGATGNANGVEPYSGKLRTCPADEHCKYYRNIHDVYMRPGKYFIGGKGITFEARHKDGNAVRLRHDPAMANPGVNIVFMGRQSGFNLGKNVALALDISPPKPRSRAQDNWNKVVITEVLRGGHIPRQHVEGFEVGNNFSGAIYMPESDIRVEDQVSMSIDTKTKKSVSLIMRDMVAKKAIFRFPAALPPLPATVGGAPDVRLISQKAS